jgi:hypothetical protein
MALRNLKTTHGANDCFVGKFSLAVQAVHRFRREGERAGLKVVQPQTVR